MPTPDETHRAQIAGLRALNKELVEALERVDGAASELLAAAQETGAFDSLLAELFPESERRGVKKREEFKRLDAARNNLRAMLSISRAALARARDEGDGT